MSTKSVDIGFFKKGDTFTVTVTEVKNNGPDVATGVSVLITVPTGVSFSSAGVAKGSYDNGTKTWTIGSLIPGEEVGASTFTWTVDDDCAAPFSFDFTVSTTGGCDSCLTNNTICIVADGTSCCETSGCTHEAIRTENADYTLLSTDATLLVDASGGVITVTLPSPASSYNSSNTSGKTYAIKVIDHTNQVTVSTPSGKIVDNTTIAAAGTTYLFSITGESIFLQSDGANWYVY